jgi:hypothetical protein
VPLSASLNANRTGAQEITAGMSTMNRSSFKKVSKNNVFGRGIFEKSAIAGTGTGIKSWNMPGHQYGSDAPDTHRKYPLK